MMKVFRFSNKQQNNTYLIFTIISAILAIVILLNLDVNFNKQIAYLLVSVLSFISIMVSIKEAGKEFLEITISDDLVKFTFRNKKKGNLSILKEDLLVDVEEEKVEFKNRKTNELIGKSYKNRIIEKEEWIGFVACFKE